MMAARSADLTMCLLGGRCILILQLGFLPSSDDSPSRYRQVEADDPF